MQEQRKTHEELLDRLNRRLRTLYHCNSMFFQAKSEQELLQSICEILVAGGELRSASIGYCEDDAERTIRLVAQSGYGPDYLGQVRISWGEETDAGQGPFGIAVRTGKACWVDDIRTDPRVSPWRDAALARGYASCLAVPLIAYAKQGAVDLRGTLNLYSSECNAFDENAVEHYTGLATSLAYAISALRSHLAESLSSGVTTLRASDERKRAQKELRRSEVYLSEAQRLSRTGSFAWKVPTDEVTWSEEHFRIFQYDRTMTPSVELIRQRVHPEDAALVKQTVERAAQDGKDFDFEHRLLMPDGSVKYVHVVARAKRDERGGLEFVGAVMDTTESKRSAEALRRSESYLAEAQRFTHTGSWAFNATTPLYWSEENFRIWGFDPQQGLPDREMMLQRIHPEDRDRVVEYVQNAVRERRDYAVEFRIVLPGGAVRYIHGLGHTAFSASGELVEVVGTSVDVTDRKRAEMLLAGEKRLLEMIARSDSRALILDALCRLVEQLASGSLSSILLLDPNTNCLRHGAAPSLPINYTEAIDGSAIGPSVGSCGTAAYRAEQVIVSDIATDPLWADYRDLALAHGLRACWSTPILSSEGRVLGTSAIYYREPRSPDPREQNLMEQITNLASIALEREQAEEALRERASLLDLTHDTVFVRDMSDMITYWNRGAEELYGWTREEAVGKVSHQLTQTIFPASLEEINAELLRTGRWEGELTHTRRDGTQVVVASRWSLQRDEQGLPAAILETNNDITERKRAEEELRVSERNLRLLIEVIPGMVCLGSAEGEIKYVNQRVLDYTGKTLEDLAGFGWTSVLHPDDAEPALSTYLQSIATGQTHEVEYRLRRWDGAYRWIQSRADPLRDSEGRIINWYGLLYDIEDRKNAEATLRKIQDELAHVTRVMTMGELTASIAHEIKQPLAAVVTNAGVCLRWLAGEPPNLDEARDAARRIIRDGNRANEVITRIRALLRKAETPKAQLDVNEAIQEVVLLTQHEAARKGVTLRLELTAGLPPVFGDRVQLQQVALNLLMNGVEAMASVNDRPRELIICSCTNESGQVLVAVQDSGEGIDRENLEEVFNAFYTTKSQGMGMGLAISRSIVENHGGRLWAEPNEGPGVTFQFTLQAYGMQESGIR